MYVHLSTEFGFTIEGFRGLRLGLVMGWGLRWV